MKQDRTIVTIVLIVTVTEKLILNACNSGPLHSGAPPDFAHPTHPIASHLREERWRTCGADGVAVVVVDAMSFRAESEPRRSLVLTDHLITERRSQLVVAVVKQRSYTATTHTHTPRLAALFPTLPG